MPVRAGPGARARAWVADGEEPGPHFRPSAEAPLVSLPLRLHADAVEELLERLPPLVAPPRWDARHVRAVEPGALLTLTLLAASHGVEPPALPVPADALLPPHPLADPLRVAVLFDAVGGSAFLDRLAAMGWSPAEARRLSSVVRELARNAVEHAGAPAWAAAWRTAPGELRIAVADAGVGLAASLGGADEREALLRALVHGASRSAEAGRGQGLRRVAEEVARWGGRMRVRSRSVLLSGAPPWTDAEVRAQLPILPGVQVEVALPCPAARSRPPLREDRRPGTGGEKHPDSRVSHGEGAAR